MLSLVEVSDCCLLPQKWLGRTEVWLLVGDSCDHRLQYYVVERVGAHLTRRRNLRQLFFASRVEHAFHGDFARVSVNLLGLLFN